MARVDRDDQMARVEKGRAIFVHELHQREEDGAAGASEFRVNGQRRYFGNVAGFLADFGQVKNALQRKADGASMTEMIDRSDG